MEFTQPELYAALDSYLRDRDRLIAEAEAEVVQWKFANESMPGPLPLSDVIADRDDDRWQPRKLQWFKEESPRVKWKHGLAADGQLCISKGPYGKAVVLHREEDQLDEIHFWPDGGTILYRHLLNEDVTQVLFEYNARHVYKREAFEFDEGRCVKSVSSGRFLLDHEWVDLAFTGTFRYEYDDAGLLRVHRFMEEGSRYNKVMYVRPGSAPSFADKVRKRRPLVAYTIALHENPNGPAYRVQCDAYGLEMTIDDEWPIDTVLLTEPELMEAITDNSDVASTDNVAIGASSPPADGNFAQIKRQQGKWILLDAAAKETRNHVVAALKAKLNVLLRVTSPDVLSPALAQIDKPIAARFAFAWQPAGGCTPEEAQRSASAVRAQLKELNLDKSRVVVAASIDAQRIMDYVSRPDIDGILVDSGSYASIVEVLQRIAQEGAS